MCIMGNMMNEKPEKLEKLEKLENDLGTVVRTECWELNLEMERFMGKFSPWMTEEEKKQLRDAITVLDGLNKRWFND